jgi:hypothetical protein
METHSEKPGYLGLFRGPFLRTLRETFPKIVEEMVHRHVRELYSELIELQRLVFIYAKEPGQRLALDIIETVGRIEKAFDEIERHERENADEEASSLAPFLGLGRHLREHGRRLTTDLLPAIAARRAAGPWPELDHLLHPEAPTTSPAHADHAADETDLLAELIRLFETLSIAIEVTGRS